MIKRIINDKIETAGHLATGTYCLILLSLAVSGLFSIAIVWHLIKLIGHLWENGVVMSLISGIMHMVLP